MKLRKLFAWLMTLVMLLGMVPTAQAEVVDCDHNWAWRWPNGQPVNCQDWKWSEKYCTKCGVGDGGFEQCGPCVPGNKTWVVPQASNCQEHGVWEITCKYCGEWLEGMEEPGPHKWSETIVEEPWCDVGGMKAMICSVCGEWQNNGTPLAPLGHDWGSWRWAHGSAPSCTEGAWQVRECKRCGRMEDRYVQGSDHKFGEWITTVEPTCTERGRHHHKCTVCGYSEWEPIPTVDHVWGEWHVIEEPQVGIPGTERRACTFGCGTHEDREIPPLEETLSAEGLELTLVLTSTPANGEYFVVGEEVVFTENWVNNTGKELYPFYVSIWTYPTPEYAGVPDIMCSWDAEETGPVTPGQSGTHQLVTTVTEADVARGAIYAMAIIISAENNGAYLADVTTPFVTAPCAPVAGSDYATSIKLEVLDIPSVTAEWAGDVYPVKVKVTNTGDTTISLYAHRFSDSNNENYPNAIKYSWNKYQDDPRGDWLPAGESLTTDIEFAVTQDGIAAGELRFSFTQFATPWYAVVNDVETNIPAEIVAEPEGTTGYYGKRDEEVTDTVEIVIPINQGAAEFDPEGLTVTKTASAGDYSNPCKPGDEVTFTITVTNNTGVELHDVEITDPVKGGNEDAIVDIIPSMQPGESVTASFNYTVTEEDATVGVEGFENTAYASGHTADGTQVSGTSETIFVWCVVEHSLTFFKSIANVPANGEFFVPGETIVFEISMIDNTPYPLYNIILTDPLCQDQYTYDAVNDMSYLYFGELYNEGNAMGESTSATVTVSYVVTEADAEAGSVTNTAEVTYQTWYGKEITASASATAPCGFGEGADGLDFFKNVRNTPANGEFFVPGEVIEFCINVGNYTGADMALPFVTDPMSTDKPECRVHPGTDCLFIDNSADAFTHGSSYGLRVYYTVTEADAAAGSVSNTATIQYTLPNGEFVTRTASATAPCGFGEPMNSAGVRLEKELRNAPANGEYYVPGEVLNYALTLRLDDGLLLDDAAIYDPIAGGDGLVISYGKGLYGGMGNDVFYVVTEEDAQRGYVENTAYATWIYQDSGEAGRCESETVIAVCGMGELPEDYEPTGILQVETFETTTPVNGTHYVEGETVILADVFTNRSANLTLTGSDWVNVEILGKGIFNRNDNFGADAVLAPGETKELLTSEYVITAEDVAQGYIQKTVHAGFVGDDSRFYTDSFEIRIPCGPTAEGDESVDADPIAVVKGVGNAPADPEGFMLGEVIEFTISVTNNLPETVPHISLVDPLIPDWSYDIYALEPGATASTTVSYTVNILDCFNGSVENYVSGRAVVSDGYRFVKSNTVSAACREVTILDVHPADGPFGVITDLEVTKEVESLPLNGLYYTEGETVAYRITYVNIGETPLTDVMIYDSLAGMTEIASAETLGVGESRFCVFNHTVTAEDVARGYVSNTAIGQFEIDGYLHVVASETVIVDTDGQSDPEIPEGILPPGGVIDVSKLNLDQYCRRVTSSRTNVSYSWGTSFCTDHANIQGSILMMEQAAATPAMQMQTAAYAVALWRAEVDKLYEELLGAADPQARAVIMAEYVSFLTHASNYETLLNARYPDQPALVAQKMAALWEEKCITLCQEMHMPVSARQDSFLAVEIATMEGISDACTCVTYDEGKGWNNFEQNYCPAHSFPFVMIDMLLAGQDTAEAWTTVRQIWNVELRSGYNKVIALLDENSDVALAEYATLESWMIAREAELTLLYPDNPELVAQTMVRIVIDQVNALCQLAQ